ncbi:hypothetical protein TTHERM_000227659 (macronuclear) [Tetrahymena thermophila SB210]|uniref:Uncharacterized protein n=1 Tax=Tetrahymena thermophila (strain SB210) TaxID=312017 RepID=W7XDM2_TETTS|nr:hypothetical protein TTHERM_000227659 [Tetrahymena thermophila SB210]EWS74748.1 hypothetical protein TTHERM_000227659 [Tetrahymena thermophila SB210]|eukprot:XP_012652749.1 hypothetical protein TTHERM_000227659 [Tetrahymena thermophila SB210]
MQVLSLDSLYFFYLLKLCKRANVIQIKSKKISHITAYCQKFNQIKITFLVFTSSNPYNQSKADWHKYLIIQKVNFQIEFNQISNIDEF